MCGVMTSPAVMLRLHGCLAEALLWSFTVVSIIFADSKILAISTLSGLRLRFSMRPHPKAG